MEKSPALYSIPNHSLNFYVGILRIRRLGLLWYLFSNSLQNINPSISNLPPVYTHGHGIATAGGIVVPYTYPKHRIYSSSPGKQDQRESLLFWLRTVFSVFQVKSRSQPGVGIVLLELP